MTTTEIVNTFLQRLGAGDADGVGELFAEEIDWYVPGHDDLPWTGRRSRRAHVPEYFLTLWTQLEPGKSTGTMEKILIDGNNAAVFSTFEHTSAKTGRSFTNPMAMLLEVSDGKIVKMHLYEDTAMVKDAFLD
jgi:ketosteroid isomerase-like protein